MTIVSEKEKTGRTSDSLSQIPPTPSLGEQAVEITGESIESLKQAMEEKAKKLADALTASKNAEVDQIQGEEARLTIRVTLEQAQQDYEKIKNQLEAKGYRVTSDMQGNVTVKKTEGVVQEVEKNVEQLKEEAITLGAKVAQLTEKIAGRTLDTVDAELKDAYTNAKIDYEKAKEALRAKKIEYKELPNGMVEIVKKQGNARIIIDAVPAASISSAQKPQ